MTGPITFDPIPVPSRQSIVDIPPSAAAQATALDGNFAKINTYLQAQPLPSAPAYSRNTGPWSVWLNTGAYQSIPANVWPGFSVIVPDADGYLVYIAGEINCGGAAYVGLVPNITGPGVADQGNKAGVWQQNRSYVTAGMATYYRRDQFIPGQRIDVVPQIYVSSSTSVYLDLAEMGIVGLA